MLSQLAAECRLSSDSLIGLCVDQYLVTRKLGQGGMGAVYEAVHVQLHRKAALKVLRPRFAQNPEAVQRFINEACIASHIHHAGLAGVFAMGTLPDGSHYFLMEYLTGETLGRRLRAEPQYGLGPALRLVAQLAETLAIVHAHGIVHCDVKPDNIMMVSDPHAAGGERPVLLDFGIARRQMTRLIHEAAAERSSEDHLLGTPLYMSPEQCRGASEIDGQSDVYALGVLLFRLCTGRFPFHGEVLELLVNHVVATPPAPRQLNPSLDPELEALILRMLAKSSDERPTLAEVSATLARLLAGPAPARPPESAPPIARPVHSSTQPVRPWAFIMCLLLLVFGTWYVSGTLRFPASARTNLPKLAHSLY